jgi:hypothetical protein
MAVRRARAQLAARIVPVVTAAAAGGMLWAATVPASAGASSVPVPTCAWASASVVSKALGERVRALPGAWTTVTAPVLTCSYLERQPLLQSRNAPILQIRFDETQRLTKRAKSKKVRRLGHCQGQSTCGAAAYLSVSYTRKPAIYSFRYVSGVDLRVQDGNNAIEIVLSTPDGPLPVADGAARLEDLMRRLLPKFAH